MWRFFLNWNFYKSYYILFSVYLICKKIFFSGEVNPAYVNEVQSVAGSRKSLSLRPVLLVAPPEQDRYSEISRAKSHSHHSLYTAAPGHPVHTMSTNTLNHSQHNFQLWEKKRKQKKNLGSHNFPNKDEIDPDFISFFHSSFFESMSCHFLK